uniref:Uncharacterized protein n=1 Tax=Meloidogyne hapla TaxID=6305 RepID=A0A1I8C100_MELHA
MSTKLFKLIQLFIFFVYFIKIVNCGCTCSRLSVSSSVVGNESEDGDIDSVVGEDNVAGGGHLQHDHEQVHGLQQEQQSSGSEDFHQLDDDLAEAAGYDVGGNGIFGEIIQQINPGGQQIEGFNEVHNPVPPSISPPFTLTPTSTDSN